MEVAQGEIAGSRLGKRGKMRPPYEPRIEFNSGLRKKHKKGPQPHGQPKGKGAETQRKASGWDKPCRNPDCGGIHRVMECSNTPDSRRKELLGEYHAREKEKSLRFKTVSSETKPDESVDATEGIYRVIVEDTVSFVALGDYGADESALSAKQFQKVLSAVPNLKSDILPEPLSLSSAIRGSSENRIAFTASQTVDLSITIVLPETYLPIRIHQVPFLVVDQEMDEIFLGRPLLKKLGFDLKSHLESVGQVVNEKSFEEPNTGAILLTRAKFTGMRYNSVDDDPIALPEAAGANIGLDDPAEIDMLSPA